jgi:peptidoglycan/xylan/chitin deacetylase (PgdA/CDA1 family)
MDSITITPAGRLAKNTAVQSFRLDRLATLYFFHPLRQRLSETSSRRIPILMYHSISETAGPRRPAYYDTQTSPAVFVEQMRFLRDNGYRALCIGEVLSRLQSGEKSNEKCVAITFDDGYRDFYTHAFPVLAECNFTATVYLPTSYIGHTAVQFKGKDCLTWDEVRYLRGAGIHFGSHSVTHPQLRLCKSSDVEYELRRSKETIENELGDEVRSFSYPYAFPESHTHFKQALRLCLQECAYTNGVSTILGTMQNQKERYFLKRLPVSSADDTSLFRAKLEGGYDWLHPFQYIAKMAKSGVQ